MKIGIVTFWDTQDNYGQLLQCYALQTYLKILGHKPFLIRYSPKQEFTLLKLKSFLISKIRHWIAALSRFLNRQSREENLKLSYTTIVTRGFDTFLADNLEMTPTIYKNIKELRMNPPQADLYIAGSDQIWHYSLNIKNAAGWYLQFGSTKTKRCSYAASMSREIDPSEIKCFVKYLKKFDAISVREKTLKNLCDSVGLLGTEIVVDPTMLLNGQLYRQLSEKRLVKDKYALIYAINVAEKDDVFGDSLIAWIERHGYSKVFISSSGYISARRLYENIPITPATIPEWLSLIDNSSMFFTTSFHGVIFSILFHKNFYWIPLKGWMAKGNNRIIELLSKLGLSDKVLDTIDKLNMDYKKIDWESCDEKMAVMRQSSYDFIKRITEE